MAVESQIFKKKMLQSIIGQLVNPHFTKFTKARTTDMFYFISVIQNHLSKNIFPNLLCIFISINKSEIS